jgi:hypothetical protein
MMMTDFELMSLFNEYEALTQVSFMNFVTIIFAFLIASFFVAGKLNKPMTIVVIGVFTFASLQQGLSVFLQISDQAGLVPEIVNRDTLQWHGVNRVGETSIPIAAAIYFGTIVFGYLGTLIFFFHQRHQGLKSA